MGWRTLLRDAALRRGYAIRRVATDVPAPYDEDGLTSHHNHEFVHSPAFQAAYARGVQATGEDYGWRWRVHVGLWAARTGALLDGDFVECGVNRGFLSSAIMHDLDWNVRGRTFWLLDTFAGLDAAQLTEDERAHAAARSSALPPSYYVSGVDGVRANFAEWKNVEVVVGSIPSTLSQVDTDRVAYLHLDMNASAPEIAALEHFWPLLAPGAPVLLDDYAYRGYQSQHDAMDAFAERYAVPIVSLPTGQGLLIRPPHGTG